jgi:hypothetical protein
MVGNREKSTPGSYALQIDIVPAAMNRSLRSLLTQLLFGFAWPRRAPPPLQLLDLSLHSRHTL